jgi:hypothetical protein
VIDGLRSKDGLHSHEFAIPRGDLPGRSVLNKLKVRPLKPSMLGSESWCIGSSGPFLGARRRKRGLALIVVFCSWRDNQRH